MNTRYLLFTDGAVRPTQRRDTLDANEPRLRNTYTVDAAPGNDCLCAHHAALVMRSNGWSAVSSAGRDYCAKYRDGRCDSDHHLVEAAKADIDNAALARHRAGR